MSANAESAARVIKALTAGWETRQIQEIAQVNPRVDKKAIPDELKVSFVAMPAVEAESGNIEVSHTRLAKEVKKGFTTFLEGDVLFAKITPCMENGKMAIVPSLVNDYGFGSTEFHVLRPSDEIDSKYLYYYVSSKSFRGEAERYMTGAVGQKRVSTKYLKEATVPVAPLRDQRHIVAEIEKQFSRLDQAVASLKRVKANLKRYKAAVLKAAVEGKLTEEWRKRNPDVEPASKLLERILAERRSKWEEAELLKMKAKGKVPRDDKWKEKYKSPSRSSVGKDDRIPASWVTCTVDEVIIESMCNGLSVKGSDHPPGVKALKLNAISPSGINYDQIRYLPITPESVEGLVLMVNDFLVVRGNGTLAFVGRGTLTTKPNSKVIFPDTVIRLRFNQNLLDFHWVPLIWQTQRLRRQIEVSAKTTAGIWKISQNDIRQYVLDIPPYYEQRQISEIVEALLSNVADQERSTKNTLCKAEKLRQSILIRAFSGEFFNENVTEDLSSEVYA